MEILLVRSFLLSLLFLCSFPALPSDAGKLSVFVSILPQKYFVERIGGEHVRVSVMVGPGQSPATYEPRPRQMAGRIPSSCQPQATPKTPG